MSAWCLLDVCSTFARCLFDVCSTFIQCLLDVRYALCMLHIYSMFAGRLLDRVNGVLDSLKHWICIFVKFPLNKVLKDAKHSTAVSPVMEILKRKLLGILHAVLFPTKIEQSVDMKSLDLWRIFTASKTKTFIFPHQERPRSAKLSFIQQIS